jgi:DNA-binding transcriptional MerR regulator
MQDTSEYPQTLRLFPDKLFYKIGEVSKIIGVEPYVLRYWETEFPFLSPRKSKSGQRIYTKNDIDLILQIKKLLYEEKYTIDGVRRKLSGNLGLIATNISEEKPDMKTIDDKKPMPDISVKNTLAMVKERLREILHQNFGA